MNDFQNFNSLTQEQRENILAYFYLLRDEFIEIREVIRELINYELFELDVRHATPIHKALNLAVFISYSRNFKNSYGFEYQKSINEEIIRDFTEAEKKLHNKMEDERDEEFAHSDYKAHHIKFNEYIDVNYSSKVVRQILDKKELDKLLNMVSKIQDKIKLNLNELK